MTPSVGLKPKGQTAGLPKAQINAFPNPRTNCGLSKTRCAVSERSIGSCYRPDNKTFFQDLNICSRILVIFLSVSLWTADAESCTLWGATGSTTRGNLTLVAKNRDWKPGQTHQLRQVNVPGGYSYLGLFALGGDSPGLKAGINEKGLVVVTATASVIPASQRSSNDGDPISSHDILTSYASVQEVVSDRARFVRSSYYMIADRSHVAAIEGAPGGRSSARLIEDGFLAQTNHYIARDLQSFNGKASRSSRVRYDRIVTLMSSRKGQLTLDDFIEFSQDSNSGPDDSIFRTGSSENSSRTVASWIVAIPEDGAPELYLTMKNPGEPFKAYSGKLDPGFWDTRTASSGRSDS